MKLKDIDTDSDRYDLQRGKYRKLCIKMWDYKALVQDISQCEDYNKEKAFVDIMRMTGGKCNPSAIYMALQELGNEQ